MPTLLTRYIFKECSSLFLLTFTIITITVMLSKIVSAVELATSASMGAWFVVELVASTLPYSISYTIPASFLASVIIVFTRLSTDNELTAIKSSGLSLTSMLTPVTALAFIVFLLSLFSNIYLYPKGNQHIKELMFQVAKTKLTAGIEEKKFYDQFKNSVLYIDKIDRSISNANANKMEGIFISESKVGSDPLVIYAKEGTLEADQTSLSLALKLRSGTIYKEETINDIKRTHTLNFDTYRIDLTMNERFFGKSKSRSTKNLTIAGIEEKIDNYESRGLNTNKLYMELYKRFAQPFSIFAFILLAIPLGIQRVRAPKFTGFTTALGLILIFQILTRVLKVAGEKGTLHPIVATFGPSIIFILIGAGVFYLALREKELPIGAFIEKATDKIQRLLWSRKTK